MKLSNLIQRQENLILNGNDNKLSNYVKTKEILTQPNDIKALFNIINNFKEERFNFFGNGRDGDLFTTGNVSFPSTTDGPTVYKYFNNLTINEGHTVTTSNRCKGLVIYVKGNCTINGTLSMTARGCRGAGEHFKPHNLDKLNTSDGILDMSIGATGGAKGPRRTAYGRSYNGYNGSSGKNGACGGGGGGSAHSSGGGKGYARSGNGSPGTTWSGGSGGGSADVNRVYSRTAGNASPNGGSGGYGTQARCGGCTARCAGGGAGNGGGVGSSNGCTGYSGSSGTGGLLILVVEGILIINGIIQSNGSNGGYGRTSGGGSGGGSITILYKNDYINNGTIQVNGGSSSGIHARGGYGGAGSIRIQRML